MFIPHAFRLTLFIYPSAFLLSLLLSPILSFSLSSPPFPSPTLPLLSPSLATSLASESNCQTSCQQLCHYSNCQEDFTSTGEYILTSGGRYTSTPTHTQTHPYTPAQTLLHVSHLLHSFFIHHLSLLTLAKHSHNSDVSAVFSYLH